MRSIFSEYTAKTQAFVQSLHSQMYGQCSHHFECKPNLKSILLLQSHHKCKLFNPLALDNLLVFSLHRGAKVPLRKQTIKHRDHQIYGKGRNTVPEAAAGEQVAAPVDKAVNGSHKGTEEADGGNTRVRATPFLCCTAADPV
jgi:hypothetical protein